MSFLDDVTPDQRKMLVSLPYRVGLYVSHSDTSGGDQSDEEELEALSNILGGFAEEVFTCETVQYVISETIRQQESWPEWDADESRVVADCQAAVDVLDAHVDEKEVSAFKQHIMEVAEAVALAFREVGEPAALERLKLWLLYTKQRLKAKREGHVYKSFQQFLNISPSERKALEALSEALDINYAI